MAVSGRAWDDAKWAVKADDAWTAGCRWLQAWWRNEQGWPPGPRNPGEERLVVTMLNEGCDDADNFFDRATFGVVEEHLDATGYGSTATLDHLLRDTLSATAVTFNLFGPFVRNPDGLLPWVQTFDAESTSVDEMHFQWSPKKSKDVPPGVSFDAFIVYRAGDSRRFVGAVCKYADDKSAAVKVRPVHTQMTATSGYWRPDASRRLDVPAQRGVWLATVLAQALVDTGQFEHGQVAMVACAADAAALTATGLVRGELADPDYWLRWSPFEEVVDALADTAPGRWLEWFRTRYLDFSPVAHKLALGDTRLTGADPGALTVDAFAELLAAGQDVLGKGGVVDQLVRGKRGLSNAIDAGGLSQRAASLAEDLKALQHAIDDASS